FLLGALGIFATSRLASPIDYAGAIPMGISIGLIFSGVVFLALTAPRRVTVKKTRAGADVAAAWEAFRRYLKDFSRLEEAPAISLELWDKYLIYAVAFGVAAEVLEHARLHAPPELVEQSHIYWYGSHGYSGGGSENAFA